MAFEVEINIAGELEHIFKSLLEQAEQYLEVDESERSELMRQLMQKCDEFMDLASKRGLPVSDVLSDLDEKLWTWFQEPPEPDTFEEQFQKFLDDLAAGLVGEGKEDSGAAGGEKKEAGDDEGDNVRPLEELEYNELQELAKEAEIAANQKKEELIDQLRDLQTTPDDDRSVQESTGESKDDVRESEITSDEDLTLDEDGETAPQGVEDQFRAELDADPAVASDFLTEANEQLELLDNLLVEAEDDPTVNRLKELFRAMHTLKGGFGFCGLDACSDLTHAAEDLLDILREDPPDQIPAAWMDLFFATMDSVRTICAGLEEALDEDKEEFTADLSPAFMEMVKSDLRDACEGETDLDAFESLQQDGDLTDEREDLGQETVNIDLDQVGEIVDLVGELVISQSKTREMMHGPIDRELESNLNQQDKILNQLQRKAMKLRMLPMKTEFNKLPRIVRDISRQQEKDIDLNIKGGDTEIDKSVLDSLHGPLVHLIRNAVDHGIESVEERRAAGKSETGHVDIRAYQESGHVYVEIEDDGAGIPVDVIEEKAIERGVIDENHDLNEEEIQRLILESGFTTTDEVTDVSGRGVGMEVVVREIENLRGSIHIDSEEGKGSKFTIELPLTVAIIDGLVSLLGNERMIFPVSQVVESINPDSEDVQWMQGRGRVVRFRDEVIPVVDPGNFLDLVEPKDKVRDRTIMVVVRSGQERYAVWINKLLSHEQIVIKELDNREVNNADLISGGAIMGDGTVGLILDIPGLVRSYRERRRASSEQSTTERSYAS